MGPHVISTARWWVDAPAARAWPLLADTVHWPRWWLAVARVAPAQPVAAPSLAWPWRALMGRPLSLAVQGLVHQPHELLTLRLRGDLSGLASFMLSNSPRSGVDITCRLELSAPAGHWRALAWLLEHRLSALLQALAIDLARALGCSLELGEQWHGSVSHR